jgi:CRP-like cAMP-binding protein
LVSEEEQEIRNDLTSIRLISDVLQPDQMDELAAACTRAFFPAGAVLMRQGEPASAMFCIVEGEVGVSHVDQLNRTTEVSRLRAGTVVGEIEILTGEPRVATVTALSDVRAVEAPKHIVEALFTKSPDLIENLGATLAIRQAILDQVAADQSRSAKARLIARMRALLTGKVGRTSW